MFEWENTIMKELCCCCGRWLYSYRTCKWIL